MALPRSYHEQFDASFRNEHNAEVPACYSEHPASEVERLRSSAVLVDRSARGRIVVSGPDRAGFLQNLFTNDILSCTPGQGIYGAFLNRHGRMLADARAVVLDDSILLDVEPGSREFTLSHLDKYHFTEKLTLDDRTDGTTQLGVFGPRAREVFSVLFGGAALPPELHAITTRRGDSLLIGIGNGLTGEPGFDLIFDDVVNDEIMEQLAGLQVSPMGWDALEMARIEAGNPRYGVELTDHTIPLEAGLRDRALSFTKGCYPGQEIIARMDARGTPAKRLVGLFLEGPSGHPVETGTAITKGERQIGTIMSVVDSPSLKGRTIAMGYVKKDIEDLDPELQADGRKVWIVPRPFYPPRH